MSAWPSMTYFNSRSCEGATRRSCTPSSACHDFNSRSCEGATVAIGYAAQIASISTHAPVKERHGELAEPWSEDYISTHAPVKERPHSPNPTCRASNFNSRSCEGATEATLGEIASAWISTHAPVKERLAIAKPRRGEFVNFNSRSCEGATRSAHAPPPRVAYFNSRSCEGATRGAISL